MVQNILNYKLVKTNNEFLQNREYANHTPPPQKKTPKKPTQIPPPLPHPPTPTHTHTHPVKYQLLAHIDYAI